MHGAGVSIHGSNPRHRDETAMTGGPGASWRPTSQKRDVGHPHPHSINRGKIECLLLAKARVAQDVQRIFLFFGLRRLQPSRCNDGAIVQFVLPDELAESIELIQDISLLMQ